MTAIISLLISIFMLFNTALISAIHAPAQHVLSAHTMSLDNRYPVATVSDVFKENILLNIAYLEGKVHNPSQVDWGKLEKPFHYTLVLQSGQTFAFHDALRSDYQGRVTKTTNAHFNSSEGFVSDGYLIGDGVCHLASLMNWVARDAGLSVVSPTNHDFAAIPEVPKKYGVAIYNSPDNPTGSAMQNLYITNNKPYPISFVFDYKNDTLKISVEESSIQDSNTKIASLQK